MQQVLVGTQQPSYHRPRAPVHMKTKTEIPVLLLGWCRSPGFSSTSWGSASSEGLGQETLLTVPAVVKCDSRAFGAFPGCVTRCFTLTSRFLPLRPAKVTIYVFLSSFSGTQIILGYMRPWRIVAVHPPKTGKRRPRLEEPSDWDSLRAALWRNWLSNAPLKDAEPELRHSNSKPSCATWPGCRCHLMLPVVSFICTKAGETDSNSLVPPKWTDWRLPNLLWHCDSEAFPSVIWTVSPYFFVIYFTRGLSDRLWSPAASVAKSDWTHH